MFELIEQYTEKFNENFPIFVVRNMTEDEIKGIIRKCLDDGKPYQVDTEEDCFY